MIKKKIYFLINSLEGGGAERVIATISKNLFKERNITIITLKNIKFYDLPKQIHHISLSNIKNNFFMFLAIPYYVIKLKKIIKKEKFDDGISSLEIANFVHILAKKNAKIAFETSIYFFTGIIGLFYKIIIKILYPKAGRIKVNSEENKCSLASYLKISKEKIEVIYNPIDLKQIKENESEEIPKDIKNKIKGKKIFITTGRLIKSKYHTKIIGALNLIYKNIDKERIFLILSDGSERKRLEQDVLDLGLGDNIIFLGLQKNVFKYLHISDGFLYASEIEGFPNVLIEAMACNLFIITSNFRTGAEECIDGEYKHKSSKKEYPYYGPNGVLLDGKNYENGFIEAYKNISKIRKEKKGFEKFDIETICKQFLTFID